MAEYTSKIQKSTSSNTRTYNPFFSKNREASFYSQAKKAEKPFFSASPIQAKLTIGQPGDKYEQEADMMADRVVQKLENPSPSKILQKKCTSCEKEEKVQKKEMGIMRKPIFESERDSQVQTKSIESQLNASKGSGNPMAKSVRSNMESAFGADFSNVKVHTDSASVQMNRDLNAKAFTNGSNIYFNSGEYNPSSKAGKGLLAHELTHTIQQGSVNSNKIMMFRNPDLSRNGFDVFFVGTSENTRAFAIQTGQNPGNPRVTLTVASQTSGMRNPPISERSMSLPINSTQNRTPRIIRETENELPTGGRQKLIELELSTDTTIPNIVIAVRYGRGNSAAPFPERGRVVWRNANFEHGWIQVTDGFRELTVNFSSEVPGSLHSSRFRPSHHPRLGLMYVDNQTGRSYIYPRRPLEIDLRGTIRFAIHLLPIVGPLVMIGEALVGRDIWGRRISTTERVLLGLGALLSTAGPLIRGARGTAATLRAANHVARIGNISRTQALRLVLGARILTGPERLRLVQYAAKIRAGQVLTQRELTAFNRILSKFEEPARIASVRAEIQALTGTRTQPGRFNDLAAQTSAEEVRAGQILARDLRSDVVRVPESTASGRRVGDFLIDDVTAELYTPQTSNIENLLRGAVRKHQQSGTMVIDISQSSIPQSQILGSTGRLFGRPEFGDVSRLIFINESRVIQTILRPSTGGSSAAGGAAIRGGASLIGREATRENE